MKCETIKCSSKATHIVNWPGSPPYKFCEMHATRAKDLGEHMGCYIHVEPLPPEPAPVKESP